MIFFCQKIPFLYIAQGITPGAEMYSLQKHVSLELDNPYLLNPGSARGK